MYRIPSPSPEQLNNYYTKYSTRVKDLADDFLNGRCFSDFSFRTKPEIKIQIGINPGSTSFAAQFLKKITSEDNFLKSLLIGGVMETARIIREVYDNSPKNLEKPTHKKYPTASSGDLIEDFNEIMHVIFVEYIYDSVEKGKPVYDKTEFIKNSGLKFCPYCGAARIEPIAIGERDIKHHIDHFLPKRRFPFLALNYFNLIPSCMTCNMVPNKGEKNPYDFSIGKLILQHPHMFKDEKFKFSYRYNLLGDMNPDNYSSAIDYMGNAHLQRGYNEVIAIEPLYASDGSCIQELFKQVTSRADDYFKLTSYLLEDNSISLDDILTPEAVLGFKLDDSVASLRHEKYKFRKDIFLQMREEVSSKP